MVGSTKDLKPDSLIVDRRMRRWGLWTADAAVEIRLGSAAKRLNLLGQRRV
ncbi:hypothetical protein bcgnr5379_63150 [Bacillus cereus]